MALKKVASVDDLVKALGRTKLAAEKLGTTPQNISNWKKAGKLPVQRYLEQKATLRRLGFEVPDSCWFADAERKSTPQTAVTA